jgi:hypothetical protein
MITVTREMSLQRLETMRKLIINADMSKIDVSKFQNLKTGRTCWGGLAAADEAFKAEGLYLENRMVYYDWCNAKLHGHVALAVFFDIPLSAAETLFAAYHWHNYRAVGGDPVAQEEVRETALEQIDRIIKNKLYETAPDRE